jgi:hypothetical protein
VTAPGSGAEVIPFLKTWVNLPMAIGFTVIYAKLANVLSTENLFYACIIPFIAFFAAFAFILYPARGVLHPTALCDQLVAAAPRLSAPIAILRNWTYCLFYVMAGEFFCFYFLRVLFGVFFFRRWKKKCRLAFLPLLFFSLPFPPPPFFSLFSLLVLLRTRQSSGARSSSRCSSGASPTRSPPSTRPRPSTPSSASAPTSR